MNPGFDPWLDRWRLVPDGAPIVTHAARLLPVLKDGAAAMLKLSDNPDEARGAAALGWWSGEGAARVLAQDEPAVLMERATGGRSLSEMARMGHDDEATSILCEALGRLHAPRAAPKPELVGLDRWFRELWPAAEHHGGVLARSAEIARTLLADPREVVVLHGDMHHDNLLDFGARGWLAIDPKGLIGERAFDYANIFTNPDLADATRPVATLPGRFARRLEIVVEVSGLERQRLLAWIAAWTGLSAAWYLGDDDPLAAIDLAVADLALAELDR